MNSTYNLNFTRFFKVKHNMFSHSFVREKTGCHISITCILRVNTEHKSNLMGSDPY